MCPCNLGCQRNMCVLVSWLLLVQLQSKGAKKGERGKIVLCLINYGHKSTVCTIKSQLSLRQHFYCKRLCKQNLPPFLCLNSSSFFFHSILRHLFPLSFSLRSFCDNFAYLCTFASLAAVESIIGRIALFAVTSSGEWQKSKGITWLFGACTRSRHSNGTQLFVAALNS